MICREPSWTRIRDFRGFNMPLELQDSDLLVLFEGFQL